MFLRKYQERELKKILQSQRSEFFYIRGRRRIGKSWLLEKFSRENSENVLYFTGKLDSKSKDSMREFSQKWSEFSGNQELIEIRPSLLAWQRIFQAITNSLGKKYSKENPLVVIFDEIQWLAKEGVSSCC
jgi:AAA+ ATPase superfamily predicted ATPase